jgi:hypothetical protein
MTSTRMHLTSTRLLVEENTFVSAVLRHILKSPVENGYQTFTSGFLSSCLGVCFSLHPWITVATDCKRDTGTRVGISGVECGVQHVSILRTINETEMIRYSIVLLDFLLLLSVYWRIKDIYCTETYGNIACSFGHTRILLITDTNISF